VSFAYPDIVEITPVVLATAFKEETEGTPFPSDASVEDDSKLRFNRDGEPIEPSVIILFPKGTNVHKYFFAKIIKLHGETPTEDDNHRRRIKYASRIGGTMDSHIEAIV